MDNHVFHDKTLVSVIVPTYKRSESLVRAVKSVLDQTYANIEVIVVDDNEPGSSDAKSTYTSLQSLMVDERIKYIKTIGKTGGGAARNYAIKFCKGEYVAFLDDDDRFVKDKVEKQLNYMRQHDLEMCYQDVEWHDHNDKLVELRRMDRVEDFSQHGILKAHLMYVIAPTAIYMIKRDALMRTEGFGEVARGQDFILMLRCIEANLKIGYMPGVYVIQYLHAGERISVGEKFVANQRKLYDMICMYKPLLSKKESRYVDFRFNAVCAFASLRGKNLFEAVLYAAKAFFISPFDCYGEAKRYFGGRRGKDTVL